MIREIEMTSKEFKDRILDNPEFETTSIQLLRNGVLTMDLLMGLFINNMLYELSYSPNINKHYFYIHNPDDKYIGCMIPFDSVMIYLCGKIVLKIRMVDKNE